MILEAFLLGNAASLTNVCLLPLYPGLIAFLAANSSVGRPTSGRAWLGLIVLAGVLSMMLLIGGALFLLKQSFGVVLPVLLPAIYALIVLLGLLLLAGRNPFVRLASLNAPILGNPPATAYVYGLLLGPLTLPCTGPLVVSAFVLGAGNAGSLASNLLYFLSFGAGFGWPLVLLPLLALPIQRRLTGWLTSRHRLLNRLAGALLVGIGLFGAWTELLPNL